MAIAACSCASTAALLPPLRRLAVRVDAIDRPRRSRAHTAATPYLGGVAIALVVVVASQLLGPATDGTALAVAALGLAALGLADDIWDLRPAPRLALEAAAGVAAFIVGARTELLGGTGDLILTVAWLVLMTNAFNLLDNMDGCAGLVAMITATGLAVAAGLQAQVALAGLAAAVAGSTAAFLGFNWFPARIFMGNAGSLFLGFLLATIPLKLRFPVPQTRTIPAIVLVAGPALFDTTLVVISRVLAGRPITAGGTDHTAHRLRRLGLSVPAVAGIIGVVTTGCAVLGVLAGREAVAPYPALVAALGLAACMIVGLLRIQVYDDEGPRPAARPGGIPAGLIRRWW